MRVLLFTGKGGVGKTTIAAATAVRAAKAGHRTLVMSTDPAHSLADAYEAQISPELTEIAPNLFGQQIAHPWRPVNQHNLGRVAGECDLFGHVSARVVPKRRQRRFLRRIGPIRRPNLPDLHRAHDLSPSAAGVSSAASGGFPRGCRCLRQIVRVKVCRRGLAS